MSDDLKDLLGNEMKHVENHFSKTKENEEFIYNYEKLLISFHDMQRHMKYFKEFIKEKSENDSQYNLDLKETQNYVEHLATLSEYFGVLQFFMREFDIR
jgi:hypothetical protein